MFVNYNLKNIKNNNISLENYIEDDLMKVIKGFEDESYDISKWKLFEIASENTDRIYGFKNEYDELLYIKVNVNEVIPSYFKNHGIDGYSLFKANTVKQAISLYDRYYVPKKELLQQMGSYRFINKKVNLEEIMTDIDIEGIVNMDISELNPSEVEEISLLDYDDLPSLQENYMDIKLTIDRFIAENLNLSKYTITEKPTESCYVIRGKDDINSKETGEYVGVDMNIQDGIAVPYYIDNYTNSPYNMFKANTITEAFEKNRDRR